MANRSPLNTLAANAQRKATQAAAAAQELRQSLGAGAALPLGAGPAIIAAQPVDVDIDVKVKKQRSFAGSLLLWFIIIALIAWFLLYVFGKNLPLVQKVDAQGRPTGQVDAGKALLGAIIIALIVVLIIWLVKGCTGNK